MAIYAQGLSVVWSAIPYQVALEATIHPNGLATKYELWVERPGCPEESSCQTAILTKAGEGQLGADTVSQKVTGTVTGLLPGYTYTYWVSTVNSAGSYQSEEVLLTADGPGPAQIEALLASHITSGDATLESRINTDGAAATYEFAIWEVTHYQPVVMSGKLPASFALQSVKLDLNKAGAKLKPSTRYAFSVTVTTAAGRVRSLGPPETFTTPVEATGTPPNEATGTLPVKTTGTPPNETTGPTLVETIGQSTNTVSPSAPSTPNAGDDVQNATPNNTGGSIIPTTQAPQTSASGAPQGDHASVVGVSVKSHSHSKIQRRIRRRLRSKGRAAGHRTRRV